ncbi:hypothetical protein [Rhodococcus daqingensis]|uniref:Peptidase M10 metallopeptidase domain-containing protein n=1 Tax=Rhodococcus daqingensis TaxID=2479363 RepID=A0ABW2S4L0_9NOCA
MTTLSVRDIASTCLGKSGDLSVDTDVYGYIFRNTDGSVFGTLVPTDTLPGSGQPTARSLKRHLETISAEAIDLFVFLVGHEDDFSGTATESNVTEMSGFTELGGLCDKDDSDVMPGAVLMVSGMRRWTGLVFAHEVGHYLGLGTGSVITNLMGVDPDGNGIDTIGINSTNLTGDIRLMGCRDRGDRSQSPGTAFVRHRAHPRIADPAVGATTVAMQ